MERTGIGISWYCSNCSGKLRDECIGRLVGGYIDMYGRLKVVTRVVEGGNVLSDAS